MMRRMRTFPAIPQSVHAARRFATDTLSGSPASTLEAVELMVSELATNCIRHERTSFHVTILGSTQEIRIEVTDSGSGTPTMRSPGPDEPTGRGLQIVDMLSGSWGVEPEHPSGKTVWFTMPTATATVPAPASEEIGTRRRIGTDAPAFARDPSTVQAPERTPNGPTCQYRRGTRRSQVPFGLRGVAVRGQGAPSGRRYCQHDESGCHARPAEHLGHLRSVAHHHDPSEVDGLANEFIPVGEGDAPAAGLDLELLDRLGLRPRLDLWRQRTRELAPITA